MNTDKLSDEILELIRLKSWDALNERERNDLLEYMDEADYTDMHVALQVINSDKSNQLPRGEWAVKESLMAEWDANHKSRSINAPLIWRAAAILFFLFSAYLSFQRSKPADQIVNTEIRRDTVYLDQMIPVVTVDTQFIDRVIYKQISSRISDISPSPQKNTAPIQSSQITDLYVGCSKDINTEWNRPKRITPDKDSLVSKFGFVSL